MTVRGHEGRQAILPPPYRTGWNGIAGTHFQPQLSKQPLTSPKGLSSFLTPRQVLGLVGSSVWVPFSQCLPRKP